MELDLNKTAELINNLAVTPTPRNQSICQGSHGYPCQGVDNLGIFVTHGKIEEVELAREAIKSMMEECSACKKVREDKGYKFPCEALAHVAEIRTEALNKLLQQSSVESK